MLAMSAMPPNGPGYGYGAPQYGSPQPGGPQYGAVPYGAPQPNSAQYGAPPPGYPIAPNPAAYTPWMDRVLASLIDQAPVYVVGMFGYFAIFAIFGVSSSSTSCTGSGSYTHCSSSPSSGAVVFMLFMILVLSLLLIGYTVWNHGYRQGITGQSIGKKVMKFKVVSESTGQPIGFGPSVVRQLAHTVDGFACNLGYLWPLWDSKRQTLADKIMSTVCIPAPPDQPGTYPSSY